MSKVVVIGDVHGRNIWKRIIEQAKADEVLFVGDYFDSFDISLNEQLRNFEEILKLDNVIRLFGNHDFHYLPTTMDRYSGYQPFGSILIQELIEEGIKTRKLQMCKKMGNYIFTHAGISAVWCNNNEINIESPTIDQDINDLFFHQPERFRFTMGRRRDYYGDDITQTPIWIRPDSLSQSAIEPYVHVVGHTRHDNVRVTPNIIFTDTLDRLNKTGDAEYIVIDTTKNEYEIKTVTI